jgi:hypothetical protein
MWTYAASLACSDIVRETIAVMRVAHENGNFNGGEGGAGEGRARAAADGVVHDLAALKQLSALHFIQFEKEAYLRVSDEDDLGAWALLVVGCDGLDYGGSSLLG